MRAKKISGILVFACLTLLSIFVIVINSAEQYKSYLTNITQLMMNTIHL